MASNTVVTHATFIPEIWAKEVQLARETRLYMANLVQRHDADVAQNGDTIHIPTVANLTAGDIGNDGSLADTAQTEGEVTISINKWKGLAINVPDILKAQSKYPIMSIYAKRMGYALGLVVEQDLLALYDGLSTNSVGTAATDLTDATLRNAVQKLDEANAPFEDRFSIIKPSQKNVILGIDKFVRYDSIPFAKDSSPIVKGNVGELYGVSFFVSNNVVLASTETKNMMWHKDAFALAMQKDVHVEKFARTQFSDRMGASELYGVAELRDDHAVKLKS